MTVITAEAPTDFAELDQLEVIDSSELKVSGNYHQYTYYCAEDADDVARAGTGD